MVPLHRWLWRRWHVGCSPSCTPHPYLHRPTGAPRLVLTTKLVCLLCGSHCCRIPLSGMLTAAASKPKNRGRKLLTTFVMQLAGYAQGCVCVSHATYFFALWFLTPPCSPCASHSRCDYHAHSYAYAVVATDILLQAACNNAVGNQPCSESEVAWVWRWLLVMELALAVAIGSVATSPCNHLEAMVVTHAALPLPPRCFPGFLAVDCTCPSARRQCWSFKMSPCDHRCSAAANGST